jgi:hypothetical protein
MSIAHRPFIHGGGDGLKSALRQLQKTHRGMHFRIKYIKILEHLEHTRVPESQTPQAWATWRGVV